MAIVGTILLLLAFTVWRIRGDVAHPATTFPAVWGTTLLLISLAQPMGYFPVQAPALLLFLAGNMVFVLSALGGSQLARRIRATPKGNALDLDFRRLTLFALLIHAALLPLWWVEVQEITDGAEDILQFAFQLRIKSVYDEITVGSLVGNYLVLGFILIPVFALGVMQGRVGMGVTLLLALPWLITNLLTNGRSSLVQLILAIMYLRLIQGQRLSTKALIGLIAMFLLIFGAGAVLVGKGGIEQDSALLEIAELIVRNFFDYALQGPILFSAYFENPSSISPSWDAFRVPCLALQRLGLCDPGPLHQDFLYFGRSGDQIGNVYSIFLSTEPRYGILGTLLILAVYGAWAAYHHQRWREGSSLLHGIVAAFLFSAIVLSIFLDSFFPLANFLIKVALTCMLLGIFFKARRPLLPGAGHAGA